ncbi:MAG TPA: nicotinate (nicotinamide) nucleotide adenylyltransferase, partial [Candidatus Eisenbacteria bacterium]|nr:nicotinate (nicotinamide) nucleotide adenylyltransferase [Candidatus Eisenbacteria bacterium]
MSHKVKVAIFGGSFDPFHKGHKNIIESLIQLEKFDEIIVMPLGLAPHKNGYMTPAGYRYEMTRLAVLDLPEITLSDYEINRPGKYSYTVDTIKYFKQKIKLDYLMNKHKKIKKKRSKYLKKHPRSIKKNYKFNKQILDDISDTNLDVRISLVYGSDALDTIESWHEPAELMKSATLWICRRGGESTEHMERRAAYLKKKYQATIKFFDITETEFSGTEIRQHLIQDKKQKNKLPDPVWKFIYQNKIYLLQDSMKKL